MRLSSTILTLFLLRSTLSSPVAEPNALALPDAAPDPMPARAATAAQGPQVCKTTGSGVRYRSCPSTKCEEKGKLSKKGTRVSLLCFTNNGEYVGANPLVMQITTLCN